MYVLSMFNIILNLRENNVKLTFFPFCSIICAAMEEVSFIVYVRGRVELYVKLYCGTSSNLFALFEVSDEKVY